MKKYVLFSLLIIITIQTKIVASSSPRIETFLEENWKFYNGEVEGAHQTKFDDSAWEKVTVPHDWAISKNFDREIDKQIVQITQNGETVPTEKTGRTGSLPYIGVGWYRITLPEFPTLFDKRITLVFDGAMSEAQVYLNGEKVGYWPNGYNSFYFDITDYINEGEENVLAVRLQNLPESSRWYPGAGIYRPVKLVTTNAIAVDTWGMFVTTPVVSESYAKVKIATKIAGAAGNKLRLMTTIKDISGNTVAESQREVLFIDDNTEEILDVKNPNLWSPESPALYFAELRVFDGGELLDEYKTRFGIRSVEITPEKGFVLNGISRKIKGVCLHHDLGPLGAELNKVALRRQLVMLKDMGADAIRTAHNMPSPWQMDLCDELGLMVMAESFDEWESAKCKNGYNRFFNEWAERDLVNLIHCHRNHPSIIMWSVGNEVREQANKNGNKIAKRLVDICHREDPTRTVTCGLDIVDKAINSGFAGVLDVPGLNYRTNKYHTAYEKLPQGFVLGSETASTVSSRGVYKFPVEERKQAMYDDMQCSSYDLEACNWSNIPEEDWVLQDDNDWVIGEFVWTGFDYLGEPTPYDDVWPSRSSYFGIIDLAGIPKDRYYLYRSKWNTSENTLHVLPHWNWEDRKGEVVPVYCYTNYPAAELFVNGVSQGIRKKDKNSRLDRYRLRWNDVIYKAGTIKVIAYNEDGRQVEEKVIKTAGKPYQIKLEADKTELAADGKDLMFVTASIVDKNGNLCPTSDISLEFSVEGKATYKAACNGDATSLEPFSGLSMKVFNGKLVVIVQASKQAGEFTLNVTSSDIKSTQIKASTKL